MNRVKNVHRVQMYTEYKRTDKEGKWGMHWIEEQIMIIDGAGEPFCLHMNNRERPTIEHIQPIGDEHQNQGE